jgi:hypothetical protein
MKPAPTADLLDADRSERISDAVVDAGPAPGSRRRRAAPHGDGQSPDPDPPGGGGGGLVRVTVNLTPKAFDALKRSCEVTGDTKTDTINRALLVYELIQRLSEQGGGSLTMVNGKGEKERIHIL